MVNCIRGAKAWATPKELRSLFSHILLHCEVANPIKLFENQWRPMSEDITRNDDVYAGGFEDHVADDTLHQYVLYELEFLLNSHSTFSSLAKYGLPMPNKKLIRTLKNKLLMEERYYDREKLLQQHNEYLQSLHPQQRAVYEYVTSCVEANTHVLAFVYGHGELENISMDYNSQLCTRSGKNCISCAGSGIASLLLPSGRIAHSRFRIPIELTDKTNCNVSKNTQLSQLLVDTTLIIWDEAPMSDRRCFEALDRTLKDIQNNNKDPFGGKSVLLGGDFRQILLVKRKATKSEIICFSLPRSNMWPKFKMFKLTQNMRVLRPNMDSETATEVQNFSDWLLSIGNGLCGKKHKDQNENSRVIDIPTKYIIPNCDEIQKLQRRFKISWTGS
ncbi:uncharacterized protein LOC143611243 [Bidens hawaiensis]|uniref:uncharacterized protein LOC143611243 n=1 Tax=Bidens hawaiensis TaxID=980011 RepID=UPI00404962DC